MRTLIHAVNKNTRYTKITEWSRLLAITGSAQMMVQILSMFSGILVIRLLPIQEYALYTLANSMLGTLTILADSGISTGIMAEGGKVWQDPQRLGSVLVTGYSLRKKFALGGLVIAMPLLLYLIRHHGAGWLMSVLIILSLVPVFYAIFSANLLEAAPKLRQEVLSLQKVQVGVNFGRMVFMGLTLFVFPWAFVAVLVGGLPQLVGNRRLRQISNSCADWTQPQNVDVRKELIAIVKRLLPTSIYFCVSGQIILWLISFFGSTTSVAQIGALGRLVMILNIFNVMFSTLVVPRYARLTLNKNLLFKRYVQVQVAVIALCICLVGVTWMFHSQVLWILGSSYSGLRNELLLNVLGNCLSLMAATTFGLYTSRGWVIKPIISIPVNIVAISTGAVLLDVSTLQGILILNIVIALVQVVMNSVFILIKMNEIDKRVRGVSLLKAGSL